MSRQANRVRGIVLTSFVSVGTFTLTACNPPMPPDVLAAKAESQITCLPGEVQVAVPESFMGSMSAVGLALGGVCPESTVVEVMDGEPAPVQLVDRAPNAAEVDAFAAVSCPAGEVITVPAFSYPVTLAYNVIGLEGMVMTPEIVSGILSGAITSWEDPLISEANPDVDFTGLPDFTVMGLEGPSGAVEAMTTWLSAKAPQEWTDGPVLTVPGAQQLPTSMDLIGEMLAFESSVAVMPVFQALFNVMPAASLPVTLEDGSELVVTGDDVQLAKVGGGAMTVTADEQTGSLFASPAVGGVPVEGNFDVAASKIVLAEGQPLVGWPVNGVAHLMTCDAPDDPGSLAFTQYVMRLAGQGALETFGVVPLPEPIRIQTFGPLKVTVPGEDGQSSEEPS